MVRGSLSPKIIDRGVPNDSNVAEKDVRSSVKLQITDHYDVNAEHSHVSDLGQ